MVWVLDMEETRRPEYGIGAVDQVDEITSPSHVLRIGIRLLLPVNWCRIAGTDSCHHRIAHYGSSGHAGIPGKNVAPAAATTIRTLGDDPAMERPAVRPLAGSGACRVPPASRRPPGRQLPGFRLGRRRSLLDGPHQV